MNLILIFSIFNLSSGFSSSLWTGDAYLDPGSGSFILQLLIASLVGAAFILKTYWRRINGYFRKLLNKEQDQEEE